MGLQPHGDVRAAIGQAERILPHIEKKPQTVERGIALDATPFDLML